MRDHDPIVLTSFRGTYDRGEEDSTPAGFFNDSQNIRFLKGGYTTRYGTSLSKTIADVKRIAVYKRVGEAQRLLILDSNGDLYDSTNLSTPILSIPAMTDFSMESIYDRAYITPHNGITGLPGEIVYVYEGSGTARAAAGVAPTSFTLGAADSATSGNVEAGTRVFALVYQTASGHLTAPGGFVALTSAGGFKVDITNAIAGPSGTTARYIVATKRIVDFDGNFEAQTYFFVPDGIISGNVTTSITIDFYDANLQDDATYLLEQLDEIPAGVGIKLINGRMCVWGEDTDPSIIRVSEPAKPESMNEADGYITVNPGDSGGGVKNCFGYHTQIVSVKSQRTYTTTPSADLPVAAWATDEVDSSVGTECHGIARSLDFGDNIQDLVFVADRAGLRIFVGVFSPTAILSHNIDDIWGRINEAYFHTVEVAIDPVEQHIYIAVPLDGATSPSHVIYGDYSEGLTEDTIRFTLWSFPKAPTSIVVDVVSNVTVFKFGTLGDNVYAMDTSSLNDFGTAIDNFVEYPFFPIDTDDSVNHFTAIRTRAKGSGTLLITMRGLDSVVTLSAQAKTLSTAPGKPLQRGFNFKSERCAVKLRVNGATSFITVTKFTLYATPLWEERVN